MLTKARRVITLSLAVLVGGFIQSANADYSINQGKLSVKHKQDIVVSLKSDPDGNLEEACLAVTFARMLSGIPLNNVTLFVTLDGVHLANDSISAHDSDCKTPWEDAITLRESLNKFLSNTGEVNHSDMVVCPLCWNDPSRYPGATPEYGIVPGSSHPVHGAPKNAIATMIGNADKILDF